MKTILLVGQQTLPKEIAKLPLQKLGVRFIPDPSPPGISWNSRVRRIIRNIGSKTLAVNGVIGLNDTTAFAAAIIAKRAKLPGTSIASVLNCQNKSWSREIQQNVLPDSTPAFWTIKKLLDRKNPTTIKFPLFIKPIKSSLSVFSFPVHSMRELKAAVTQWQHLETKPSAAFQELFSMLTPKERGGRTFEDSLIVEELIKAPEQVTVDGFLADDRVEFFGATHSAFVPGTLSFSQFSFPFALKPTVYTALRPLIRALGLTNTLFNIELKYNPRTGHFWIIEINARVSQQFMHLIYSVTGVHPLSYLTPTLSYPRRGCFRVARCYILRTKADARVVRVPFAEEITALEREFPGVAIAHFVAPGKNLSDFIQDAFTFRYAEIKIPGKSFSQTDQLFKKIRKKLQPLFKFDHSILIIE